MVMQVLLLDRSFSKFACLITLLCPFPTRVILRLLETHVTRMRPMVLSLGNTWLTHSDHLASCIPWSPRHDLLALAMITRLIYSSCVSSYKNLLFWCVWGQGGGAKVCLFIIYWQFFLIWRNVFTWSRSTFGGMFTPHPLPAVHIPSSQHLVLWVPHASCWRHVMRIQADTDILRFWS